MYDGICIKIPLKYKLSLITSFMDHPVRPSVGLMRPCKSASEFRSNNG